MKGKILFQETQKFTQWWLYLIVIATALTILFTTIAATAKVTDFIAIFAIVFASLIGLIMMLSIFIMKLKTTITESDIQIYFYPLVKRKWNWSELKKAEIIDYGFVGGWGIRIWTGMGTVFNVRGSKGLHFKTDSKEYVIGTQKEEEMRSKIGHLLK